MTRRGHPAALLLPNKAGLTGIELLAIIAVPGVLAASRRLLPWF